MAAPEGNRYWEMRKKNGRNKIYETAELLFEAAVEYFQWSDDSPWYKREAIKGGDMAGQIIEIPTERPYTQSGLCIYLGISPQTWANYKDREDFLEIVTHVEEIIRTQKFEGAAVGAFNANIIARDLGLADKSDVNANVHLQQITGMEFK